MQWSFSGWCLRAPLVGYFLRRPAPATLALLRPYVNGMAGATGKSGERPHLCERVAKSKGRPGYGECRFLIGPETTSTKVIYQEP